MKRNLIKKMKKLVQLIEILLQLYPDNYKVRTAHADYLVKNSKYRKHCKNTNYVLSVEKNNYFIWEQVIFIENTLGNNEEVYIKKQRSN